MLMEEQIRKIKRYDVVVEYLKRQMKKGIWDTNDYEEIRKEGRKEAYEEILKMLEEGKK